MRIYTRRGDKGETSTNSAAIVPKDHPRVEAYGTIDELNAILGVVISFSEAGAVTDSLKKIQTDLFVLSAEFTPHTTLKLSSERVSELEAEIDSLSEKLPPLHNFILPGGSKTASLIHLARTVCRRAERAMVALSHSEQVSPDSLTYLNRVGDLLFVLARQVNQQKKVEEVIWKGK